MTPLVLTTKLTYLCNLLLRQQGGINSVVNSVPKIPLVLTTKLTHLCNLLLRQQGGINSVVGRVYLAITAKLFPTE